jgi:MipA family protein
MKMTCSKALAFLALAGAVPAYAQPAQEERATGGDRVTIGLGGGIAPSYDGASNYKFQPGGLIQGRVSGFDFAVRGPNIYVDLIREDAGDKFNIIAGPVAQLRLDRTGKIKDPRVALFGKRDAALEVGGYIGIGKRGVLIPPASVTFDVTFVHDVTGEHRSYVIKPTLSLSSPVSRNTFAALSVSGDFVGKGYGRTYFDVPVIAAPIPTLTGYATKGSGFKDVGVNLLLSRALNPNPRKGWSVFALTGYSRLLGQYARSPIVADAGDANQVRAIAGLAYSF